MTDQEHQHHFIIGMQKSAESHGLSKEAFFQILPGLIARIGGTVGADLLARRGLQRLATAPVAGKVMGKKREWLHRKANNILNHIKDPNSGKGMLWNTAISMGSSALASPVVEPVAGHLDRTFIPAERP